LLEANGILLGTAHVDGPLRLEYLQAGPAQLFSYEYLPWNPSRLERRKGRTQRIGRVRDTVDT
jgi:hypothetical protein